MSAREDERKTEDVSQEAEEQTAYDREAKLKELLAEDEKRSAWADEFMGF